MAYSGAIAGNLYYSGGGVGRRDRETGRGVERWHREAQSKE